jgi:cellulose synthase/poly-beta-1,6-N-acetylglucosamine synthase-like glycosyltransferase
VPTLTAIVPAWNRPPTLGRCIEAVRAAGDPPEELLVMEEPVGAADARNAGAQRATGEVLMFVDADVEVHRDAFGRIRAAFDADPDLTAVFGSYDDAPDAPGAVSAFRNLLHHHVHQASGGPAFTFWAGLGAMRRDSFLGAGGFDPSNPIEDIELGMRLTSEGARIVLDPRVQGKHLKEWTFWGMVRTDFAIRGAPWVVLLLRHRLPARGLNLGWRHRLSAVACLVGVAAVALRRPRITAGAALALVALNHSFYALLLRQRGPAEALLGVGLHAVHHLTGAAALPVGALSYLLDRRPVGEPPSPSERTGAAPTCGSAASRPA